MLTVRYKINVKTFYCVLKSCGKCANAIKINCNKLYGFVLVFIHLCICLEYNCLLIRTLSDMRDIHVLTNN